MKGSILAIVAVAGLCAFAIGQPPAPVVPKADAARPRGPGGIFADGLGVYLTIEGVKADEGKVGGQTLLVDTENGQKLNTPVAIWVENLLLPAQKRCVLKGYESGKMIGVAPAVYEAAKELGKERGSPQAAWQWYPFFVALIVVEPKGLELPKE